MQNENRINTYGDEIINIPLNTDTGLFFKPNKGKTWRDVKYGM